MFGMQGPQALPDNESYAKFWSCATKIVTFALVTAAISKGIGFVEGKAHDHIIEM